MNGREPILSRLSRWPVRDRVLILAALVMVGFIVYSLVALDTGRVAQTVADVTSTTVPSAAQVTATTLPSAAEVGASTAPPVTQPPVTQPPVTQAPVTQAPVTAPSAIEATATSAPSTLAPKAAVTTAPPTTSRVGPFCGYAPGAIIEIDLNGQPSGRQTADEKGCVIVNR